MLSRLAAFLLRPPRAGFFLGFYMGSPRMVSLGAVLVSINGLRAGPYLLGGSDSVRSNSTNSTMHLGAAQSSISRLAHLFDIGTTLNWLPKMKQE